MTGILDTSMLVRYVTGAPPEMADAASQVIDNEEQLFVTDVMLAETAYVLTSVYGVPRQAVVDALIAFLRRENVSTLALDKSLVIQGLMLARPSGRVSFADAMIWAAARSAGVQTVYSLGRRFPGDGVEIRGEARRP